MAGIRPLVLIPPVAFAALVGLFAGGMYFGDDELPTALAGQPAPVMAMDGVPGLEPFDPQVLADGEVKLVNFWASWCAPCRTEHPNLAALAQEGLPIYGINYKDAPANALSFLAEMGDFYTAVGADPQGRVATEWGVYGVPETFVVDGDGVVVARIAGPVTQRVTESRLRPALQDAGGS